MEKASWKPIQVRQSRATLHLSMTAKQPPSYDGKLSWFRYEELVDDWVTITTVEAAKRGPLLKSRLTGDAYMYKAVLQNDLLQDPDEGVNYFKNTLKKYFLKGATNVYLYRLLSFFNHRRQNQEFLIFTSKFEILLMRLKAAWMDLMPIFTAQSPSFRQSVQDANARTIARHQQAAGARAPPPALPNEDDPTVLGQYIQGMQDRQRDAFPFGDNLIAQFFIIQSELSDQQRERLTSAMSLRNISLENYSYEMLKTHYQELFITTRTSIQDPSIRPQGGSRSNTFFIIEQGEYEGKEGFWVEDEEGLEGFMSNNDEDTFWVLEENDAFIERKVSGRNFKFKKRKGKGKSGNKKGSPQRGGFKPFRKSGSGGKANMANENYDPYDKYTVQAAAPARKRTQLPLADVSSFSLGIGSDYCICLTVQKRGGRGEKGVTRGPKACQERSQVGAGSACPVQENAGSLAWAKALVSRCKCKGKAGPGWAAIPGHQVVCGG